jgi:hypothetical protein
MKILSLKTLRLIESADSQLFYNYMTRLGLPIASKPNQNYNQVSTESIHELAALITEDRYEHVVLDPYRNKVINLARSLGYVVNINENATIPLNEYLGQGMVNAVGSAIGQAGKAAGDQVKAGFNAGYDQQLLTTINRLIQQGKTDSILFSVYKVTKDKILKGQLKVALDSLSKRKQAMYKKLQAEQAAGQGTQPEAQALPAQGAQQPTQGTQQATPQPATASTQTQQQP